MTEERRWEEWAADFRSGGPTIRAGEVARRARRSGLALAAEAGGTVAASVGVAGVVAHRAWAEPHPVVFAIAAVVIAFLAVTAVVFFRVRRGAWRAHDRSPRELLALLRRREEARIREARFSARAALALGAAVTLWLPWKLWVDWAGYAREPWRAALGIGGVYALLAVSLFGARRWRRSRERALAAIAGMEKGSVDGGEEGGAR